MTGVWGKATMPKAHNEPRRIMRRLVVALIVVSLLAAVAIGHSVYRKHAAIQCIRKHIEFTATGQILVEYRDHIWARLCSADTLERLDCQLGWPLFGRVYLVGVTNADDHVINAISHLTTVRWLKLSGLKNLTPDSWVRLAGLRSIKRLVVSEADEDEVDWVFRLANYQAHLLELAVGAPDFREADLAHCKEMRSLISLRLLGGHVSEPGLQHLASCSTLRLLSIDSLVEVSNSTITYLKRQNPQLSVGYYHITP
jgi:hypothetical protein